MGKLEECLATYREIMPEVRGKIRSKDEELKRCYEERKGIQKAIEDMSRKLPWSDYIRERDRLEKQINGTIETVWQEKRSSLKLLQILTYLTNEDFREFEFRIEGSKYGFLKKINKNEGRRREIITSEIPAVYADCELCNGRHPHIYGETTTNHDCFSIRRDDDIYMVCNAKAELVYVKHLPNDSPSEGHYLDGV